MRTTKALIGARIKEIRKATGLSQETLAERIGIDAKHLSRLEVGKGFPSLDTLERMAQALGVELREFFEFAHLDDSKDIKSTLTALTKHFTAEQARLAVKLLRALVR